MDLDARNILISLLPFLKSNSETIIDKALLDWIKIMIFQLLPEKIIKNDKGIYPKLDEAFSVHLTKYQGKRYFINNFLVILLVIQRYKIIQ